MHKILFPLIQIAINDYTVADIYPISGSKNTVCQALVYT